ncbi:HAAS signaling domain-containing protein [Ornithinibacillus scapharcae]|uniref:HAAS signaling domain-containing protein n=1 Tax=Ornithinibacillus scapharcae TaxID=1147159 RepID=UPI000225AB5B|nr:membrane protein [Ornithinibacillus scapharcae]
MTTGEERFLQELDRALAEHPEKEQIIAEYRSHIYEVLREELKADNDSYELIVNRLGSPKEIASLWAEEAKVTPRRMQILFVVLNILIFLGGIALTVAYNVFQFEWIEILWERVTAVPSIIIMVYMIFWGLLGYEIGKEFGSGGLKIVRRTFTYAIIPNLVLMYLIVFKLIPHEWFQPLLNGPFILACILLTLVLYPISWIGYRWGRKASL